MPDRTFTIKELGFDPRKLGPNSPLRDVRPRPQDHEHQFQVALFEWIHEQEALYPEFERIFAVPNFSGRQGRRTARQGARLKAEGRRPGVPDCLWPLRRDRYVGLALELKVPGRKPTVAQNGWLAHLHVQSWKIVVGYELDQVKLELMEYYRLPSA